LQNTLKTSFSFSGKALHSGQLVNVKVLPAPANFGICFKRTDVTNKDQLVPAIYNNVSDTKLCTKISNQEEVSVQTIEHIMAAFAGTGIHNVLVEVDGPEIPIMDGSSREFVRNILRVGYTDLGVSIKGYKIEKQVLVKDGLAWAKLMPADTFSIDFDIDYSDTVIGRQKLSMQMNNGSFVRELCDSRTFCRENEISKLLAQGFAKGGSLENAIVLSRDTIKNVGGFRRDNECVRHKMLDAMGDLSLAGGPIFGAFSANRGGHTLTNRLLRAAFSVKGAMKPTIVKNSEVNELPGFGLCENDLCHLN
jgi:UDP-3-O-[3-hydroxymyristoyl] N-acetylglucosamine deacetylase